METKTNSIFQLDVLCFVRIFDWLSLAELYACSQTCKRFHAIIGDYFQHVYRSTEFRVTEAGIYACSDKFSTEITQLAPYIKQITINNEHFSNNIHKIQSNCVNLTHIQLVDVSLSPAVFKSTRKLFKQIEFLEIVSCACETDKLYEILLKFCKNLRRLSVRQTNDGNKWLTKAYPKLVHLELFHIAFRIDELAPFFRRNKSIRSLSIDANCLWHNEQTIIKSNIRLNELIVDIYGWEYRIESLCGLFDRLFNRECYEKLHLYTFTLEQSAIERMSGIRGLVKLHLNNLNIDHNGTWNGVFSGLKEICFRSCPKCYQGNQMLQTFRNVERIHVERASASDIRAFVGGLPKLNEISVNHLDFDNMELDLKAMNEQRKQLYRPCKCYVFIEEQVYLKAKQNENENQTHFVEIERIDTLKLNHHFEYSHRV